MYKLVVIANPEYAYGFRLAGVDVLEARDQEEARSKLLGAINDDRSGIVAVDEEFMNEMDDALTAKIERMYRPIVISIPTPKSIKGAGTSRKYLARFIKRAIGFDIKLREE